MHFEVDAIVHVTSVPVARGEQFAGLFRRFRPRASRPGRAFLWPIYATDFAPGCPNPRRGAQVETPQRVAPQAGFFYRRGRE